jgi:simple sugar transport system substrate-binding protein
MTTSRTSRLGLLAIPALVLAACTQAAPPVSTPNGSSPAPVASGSSGAQTADVPAPFDQPPVRIALVRQLGSGDYFEQWLTGAQEQADALGIDLRVSDARGDDAAQATNLDTAINQGVAGIILDHGQTETLKPGIDRALAAGIPVVAFDVNADNPKVPQIEQSDAVLAQRTLESLVKDTGGKATIGYVYVAGFAPLDRRDEVFQDILTKNPGLKLAATWGKVSDSTAADVQGQTAAALTANPDITAIFAPFDEFAKGAVLAIEAAGLQDKVKVYGADISTADIGVMTAKDSPWTATAAADPANVGRVAVRAVALQVAGERVDAQISVEPALITRDFLVQHAITTMEQLRDQLPELTTPNLVNAPWFAALGG